MSERCKINNNIQIGMIAVLLFLAQSLAGKAGEATANLFDYSYFDKENVFLWITVHHLVQMLIALLLLWGIHKITGICF